MASPDGLTMRFSATLENVDAACNEVSKMIINRGAEKSVFAIELLIREALNNAVLHGSRRDPAKTVECAVRFDQDHLVIEVHDEGDGFGWQSAIRETRAMGSPSGRGLPIMRAYAAEVSFNEKGNGLLLKVSLPREEAL